MGLDLGCGRVRCRIEVRLIILPDIPNHSIFRKTADPSESTIILPAEYMWNMSPFKIGSLTNLGHVHSM